MFNIFLREGGFMPLLAFILLWLLYLYFGWPSRVARLVKNQSDQLEKQSNVFAIVALSVLISVYVVLVLLQETIDWWQTGTVFTALTITVAILFTAIRLFPPTFHAFFVPVIDSTTGDLGNERTRELSILRGEITPIFLAIINISTFTWDNFRVTIDLPDDIEAKKSTEQFPNCQNWDYAAKEGLTIGRKYIQAKSSAVLTIGETLATRFFLTATKAGVFDMKIMMTSAGRIGERRQSIKVRVIENEKTDEQQTK